MEGHNIAVAARPGTSRSTAVLAHGSTALAWPKYKAKPVKAAPAEPRSFVSTPERLLLVRRADAETPESALVVPDLAEAEVVYFRCLVDEEDATRGALREHAIVWGSSGDEAARERIRQVLSLRRPLAVSFAAPPSNGEPPSSPDGNLRASRLGAVHVTTHSSYARGGILAAAVVVAHLAPTPLPEVQVLTSDGARHVVHCFLERRVYSCKLA
jgi:hypothetical protein